MLNKRRHRKKEKKSRVEDRLNYSGENRGIFPYALFTTKTTHQTLLKTIIHHPQATHPFDSNNENR